MELQLRASTGLKGFDAVIDDLRLGDNVVWQVDSVEDYLQMADPFIQQAKTEGRKLVYVCYDLHKPILEAEPGIRTYHIDPSKGFESFAAEVHNLIAEEGRKTFYVFDCLSGLLPFWYSDRMIANFFKVTCPYLYELDTIAYFAILRNRHTFDTIAGIRETTQLLLDLYHINGEYYIHPLKAWQRYSPTMFFPHLIQGTEAISITASSEVSGLFSSIMRIENRMDYWDSLLLEAKEPLPVEKAEEVKTRLMNMLISRESRMFDLCYRFFRIEDILKIASKEIGTGMIGGKSVGMLLARRILEKEGKGRFTNLMEMHDSFYLGTDVFYSYIVENGWWRLRMKQKTEEGYYRYAGELQEKLGKGRFPKKIQEQFIEMLEHFGQSPIILRSSSLLEDNFGNAFAGKYESIFCANKGTPEERYEAFEQAIRDIYASMMNEDVLNYRMSRSLCDRDEQMAILIQRVSGDQYGSYFFPHLAGVGNSSNLYVWDKRIDMDAGMLRLVFGLGTRAVDRIVGDYVKIISLDDPMRIPPIQQEDIKKYSQHKADVLDLQKNSLTSINLEEILELDIRTDKGIFASIDYETAARLQEAGYTDIGLGHILDFRKLFRETDFITVMKEILALLAEVYDYPVDIEFTVNFKTDNSFKVNLLQCRPLQTRNPGKPIEIPGTDETADCLLAQKGNFMGGNVRLPIDYVIYVDAQAYLALPEQGKYDIARKIGVLNKALKDSNVMLMGPGRWGTTTPSLGIPVIFAELAHMTVICERSSKNAGFMPELSYGSHFFQDLVESDIFYIAIFDGYKDVVFHPELILKRKNHLTDFLPDSGKYKDVIQVAKTPGLEVYSDIVSQKLLCNWSKRIGAEDE